MKKRAVLVLAVLLIASAAAAAGRQRTVSAPTILPIVWQSATFDSAPQACATTDRSWR